MGQITVLAAINNITRVCIEESLKGGKSFRVEINRVGDAMCIAVCQYTPEIKWINGSIGFEFYSFNKNKWNHEVIRHLRYCREEVRRISNER